MSATALRAEAADKDELAVRLTSEARALGSLLDPVVSRIGGNVWRGPAADDFSAAARRWRGRLDDEADTLLAVARRLRATSDELRAEAARIEAAERAEAAAAAARAQRLLAPAARSAGDIG